MSSLADAFAAARRQHQLEVARQEQRDVELTLQERYARDPFGWINDFVVVASFLAGDTHDRQRIRAVRMRLFPQQEETIAEWIDLGLLADSGQLRFRNLVIDKSRQIGETVGLCAALTWLIHHHRVVGLCMHVKLPKIDDGGRTSTWESMFGKVRYIDQRLPRDRLSYLGQLSFRRNPSLLEVPATGSVVHGKGQDDDPGRGDSFDFAIVDEAARVEHGELVHQSLAAACPDGKVYLSTPEGSNNMHARIADTKPAGWRYLRLHWSEHPVYSIGAHVAGQDPGCELCAGNRAGVRWEASEPRAHRYPGKLTSPWYDREIADKTNQQVASEYDIDRAGSLPGRVFDEYDPAVHVVNDGIPWSPDLPVELAIDYGLDTTSVIVLQNAIDEVRAIGLLEMGTQHGTSGVPEHVCDELRRYLVELGIPEKDTRPEFSRAWRCVGDPAGHDKQQATGRSLAAQYRRQGFNIGRFPRRLNTIQVTTDCVRRLLLGTPKRLRICGVNAAELGNHLAQNKWKTDRVGGIRFGRAQDLDDDIHNHACRSLAYWATATFPPVGAGADLSADALEADTVDPDEHLLTRRHKVARGERHGDADLGLQSDLGYDQAL